MVLHRIQRQNGRLEMKVKPITLHPFEITSELSFVIAHCIGADNENDEEVANKISHEFISDVFDYIRKKAEFYEEG